MTGPFPGMDPYIESHGSWSDFHNRLITEACNALSAQLPGEYVPRVDERIEVASFDDTSEASFRPDVLVARHDAPARSSRRSKVVISTITPALLDVSDHDPEEFRHTWLEIRRLPEMELVTVVEVLSPSNKTGIGRAEYLEKRRELHSRKINLVEIDLLLEGRRVPMKKPLPKAHYFAVVARGDRLPTAEVYAWTLRDRLPSIPIPLRPPDKDVSLDLAELIKRVYDLGRYARTLRYDQTLPQGLPLHGKDRAWAESFGRAP